MSGLARHVHVAEPPAHYLSRPPLVVDCSLVASALFDEALQADADLQMHGRKLLAPHLLSFEFMSVALRKAAAGAGETVSEAFIEFNDLDIELFPVDLRETLAIAQRHGLSTYDASYLWLAAHKKAPLATFDAKLAAAARTHLAGLE